MDKFVIIWLLIAALLGFSSFTVTSHKVTPSHSVTVSVSPKILEWSITFNTNNYQSQKYFDVQKPGYYVLQADGNAPKGQITIQIQAPSGIILKEVKASHLKGHNRVYLEPGRYRINIISKNAKHSNYRVYINSAD